jgi:hypothetical protein
MHQVITKVKIQKTVFIGNESKHQDSNDKFKIGSFATSKNLVVKSTNGKLYATRLRGRPKTRWLDDRHVYRPEKDGNKQMERYSKGSRVLEVY